MKSNSHRVISNQQIMKPTFSVYSEDMKTATATQVLQALNTRDSSAALNLLYQKNNSSKQETIYVPSPMNKNNSFSDIISPQNLHTVTNMSLEKELEKNVRKSLNTMSGHSDLFEESSIHKDEENKQGPSALDLKEHDSLLNGNVAQPFNNQPNKHICILCHNSKEVEQGITGTKMMKKNNKALGGYDLIFPCLCRIRTHRECMKSYLLIKKVPNCERCKTGYAICGKSMKEIRIPKEALEVIGLAFFICVSIIIAGIILIASSLSEFEAVKGVIGIVISISGVLGIFYLIWRVYFSNKVVDIAVYCKQTEIARHRGGAEQTLRKFVEQEEKRRGSRVLKKAKKLFGLQDVTEFENFVKMTTPRIDKPDKVTGHERNTSSNFLLSDPSKIRDHEDEEVKKKTRKEIFIGPNEVEKSENTVPDYPSNVNEYSAKLKNAAPIVRVTSSNPSKHADLRKNLIRLQRMENRPRTFGSQSERQCNNFAKRPELVRFGKVESKDPQSASSVRALYGLTERDSNVDSPELLNRGPPRRAV